MYTPSQFRVDDTVTLSQFVRQHSFATFVTHDGTTSHATHLPMHLQSEAAVGELLTFHMARANPQWRHCRPGTEVMAIFTGPHAYISPARYAPGPNVPTWNYTAVHIYGQARVIDSADEMTGMLNKLVDFYEAGRDNRWFDQNPTAYRDQLIQAIVGIELKITRIEGKFKLSQNRSEEDQQRVMEQLSQSAEESDRAVARMMRDRDT